MILGKVRNLISKNPFYIDQRNKKDCTGCGVCVAVCKNGAIQFSLDEEGFRYPYINKELCINCGCCDNICSFLKDINKRNYSDEKINKEKIVQLGRHVDINVVNRSRSGGIFVALSDRVLSLNGSVYGVLINEKLQAIYSEAEDIRTRDKMCGSKYVQSFFDVKLFGKIERELIVGKYIMFTGTPCQVAAIKSYLNKDYDNLLCMDIVCHGVLSPLMLSSYIKAWEEIANAKCKYIDFRNKKKYGWRAHYETMYMDCGKEKKSIDSNLYASILYCHNALRPCCYQCPYKSQERQGDVSLGDCWGVEKVEKKFDDNMGCSIVFINTEKGKQWFDSIRAQLDTVESHMNEELFQIPLHKSFEVDMSEREYFWKVFFEYGIKRVMLVYGRAAEGLIYDNENLKRDFLKISNRNVSSEDLKKKKKIIPFGAGNIAKKYIPLIDLKRYTIVEIWDNYSNDKMLFGNNIVRPHAINNEDNIFVLLFIDNYMGVKEDLKELGIKEHFIIHYRKFLEMDLVPFYERHEEILNEKNRWIYEEMRSIYYEGNRNLNFSLC